VQSYLQPVGDYLSLNIGAAWDPNKEICDNDIDDNKDGNVDCDDSSCANDISCMEKKDIPEVEVFVMSHCPYGTQIEKGILPVVETLGDSIDFELKFVNYAMHPTQGEVEEQLNQYCIQRDYEDKFMVYLTKFLEKGSSADAFAQIGITQEDISACVKETDEKFDVIKNLEDEASWMNGRFPKFMIHNDENLAYGVQGSPSLIINGVEAQAGRDAQSLLNAICSAFTNAPAECNTDFDFIW